ncbi:MAG: bifunctional UDP-N-acetylglucosamine diphosphorylase/glucosamine-1-phosphate N-acetyltransferase GlmU [Gammaproteobacteria bacterium]|nr:bifunctional UDP-N-acetylglucosamine diphosphorylase/glucosamine-1-phosphate N-acetyltransferase GlmU [Gammaproteobacteria bacterium]
MTLSVVILAAGQGTRMKSELPKVLHKLAGRTLLQHVYETASSLGARDMYIVYGYGGEKVREYSADMFVNWVEQRDQLGTGHAVQQVIPDIPDEDHVLILYGDVPLITVHTLNELIRSGSETGFGLLTVEMDDPTGYGRIVRDEHGKVLKIVEQKDASDDDLQIREVNTGFMLVRADLLKSWLSVLQNDNAQGEYYLTDIIENAVADGIDIITNQPESIVEVSGINSRAQLAEMERYYQLIQAHQLMRQGVSLADPGRFDVRGSLETGQDVEIDINVIFEGEVKIGNRVKVGPNTLIRDSEIMDDVEILANCVIEESVIGDGARIGPFARLRPGTSLKNDVRVGNFVEIKKSVVCRGSKINHLSYIGDTEIGVNVNIGAGTITCNYDGAHKHKTIIGDNVFVGSDCQLVAPVRIGADATIGAGTTVTDDVEPTDLVLSRTKQISVQGWKRPTRDKK